MNQGSPDPVLQALNLVLILANVVVYFSFIGIAAISNRAAKRELLKPRLVGSIGILLFSILAAAYVRAHFVDERLLASLPPYQQGQYLGEVTGVVIFPAILVLVVVAIRGWLARKKGSQHASA